MSIYNQKQRKCRVFDVMYSQIHTGILVHKYISVLASPWRQNVIITYRFHVQPILLHMYVITYCNYVNKLRR